MNEFYIILNKKEGSNQPKPGQFGELLSFLASHAAITPPNDAQYNEGVNLISVETILDADKLEALLHEAGFAVSIGKALGEKHA